MNALTQAKALTCLTGYAVRGTMHMYMERHIILQKIIALKETWLILLVALG